MSIEPILTPHYPSTQCNARPLETLSTRMTNWRIHRYGGRREGWDPCLCYHPAVFLVDGVPLCKKHAAAVSLLKWLSGDLIESSGGAPTEDGKQISILVLSSPESTSETTSPTGGSPSAVGPHSEEDYPEVVERIYPY